MAEETTQKIKKYVSNRLYAIINGKDESNVKALLAQMRRGAGRQPGDIPALWGLLFDGFPEELMQPANKPGASRAEWAVYSSLTLFSLHQQGHDPGTKPMHVEREYFGLSVRKLASPGGKEDDALLDRVRRRFNIVATSTDIQELNYHLRTIMQMLRASGIPTDYAQLAADIYWYQDLNHTADVRLQWGQDFYRYTVEKSTQEEQNDEEE